jgi:hypothetical protein
MSIIKFTFFWQSLFRLTAFSNIFGVASKLMSHIINNVSFSFNSAFLCCKLMMMISWKWKTDASLVQLIWNERNWWRVCYLDSNFQKIRGFKKCKEKAENYCVFQIFKLKFNNESFLDFLTCLFTDWNCKSSEKVKFFRYFLLGSFFFWEFLILWTVMLD